MCVVEGQWVWLQILIYSWNFPFVVNNCTHAHTFVLKEIKFYNVFQSDGNATQLNRYVCEYLAKHTEAIVVQPNNRTDNMDYKFRYIYDCLP